MKPSLSCIAFFSTLQYFGTFFLRFFAALLYLLLLLGLFMSLLLSFFCFSTLSPPSRFTTLKALHAVLDVLAALHAAQMNISSSSGCSFYYPPIRCMPFSACCCCCLLMSCFFFVGRHRMCTSRLHNLTMRKRFQTDRHRHT